MKGKTKITLFLVLLSVFMVIPCVYASDDDVVNLPDFPQQLANALGMPTNLFAAQLLASSIILSLFLLPMAFACSKFKKDAFFPCSFVGVTSLSLCVALEWLPVWIFTLLVFLVALLTAARFKEMI